MKARPEAEARSKCHSGVANKIRDPGEVLQRWGFGRVRRGVGGCQTETDLLKLTERKARVRERKAEREQRERERGEEKEVETGQERERRGGEREGV